MAAADKLHVVDMALTRKDVIDCIADAAPSSGSVFDAAQCKASAAKCMQNINQLVSKDGVPIASLTKREVAAFIRDAPTGNADMFTSSEFQALMSTLTRYASLKSRHNKYKRWSLGVGLSTIGTMALATAMCTSAGLLLVAAPAGAAIGAVAAAADGSKARRRDRRTAQQNSASLPAVDKASSVVAEGVSAGEVPLKLTADDIPVPAPAPDAATLIQEAIVPEPSSALVAAPKPELHPMPQPCVAVVAPESYSATPLAASIVCPPDVPIPAVPVPAPVVSSGSSSPQQRAACLDGGVLGLAPASPGAADSSLTVKTALPTMSATTLLTIDDMDVPMPVVCDSPFAAASKAASGGDLLPPPSAIRTSVSHLLDAGSFSATSSAALPPKPKSKSLTKQMTKSVSKSLKRAFSLKDKDTVKDSKACDADNDSPLAPPVPPRRSGSFFRRSSSDMYDESVEGVERSKGSATIKKMVEGIRRSFSLDRPSLDLFQPKKARKSQ